MPFETVAHKTTLIGCVGCMQDVKLWMPYEGQNKWTEPCLTIKP